MTRRTRAATAHRRNAVGAGLARAAAMLRRGALPAMSALAFGAVLLLLERGLATLYAEPVRQILVSGKLDSRYREAVRDTVAERIDGGLLALDLRSLRAELEQLPWIYRATLRREYPGTLKIHVIEQLPIARWGETAFLNHEARVVEVADEQRWQSLPLIRGPEGSRVRLMNRYQRLLDLLRPLELSLSSLEEDAFGQLTAQLDNGLLLRLGSRDFASRIERFLMLWRRELRDEGARVVSVDMRYAGGAAVAFGNEPRLAALEVESQGG